MKIRRIKMYFFPLDWGFKYSRMINVGWLEIGPLMLTIYYKSKV
jgi:hypothetical protein